MIKFILLTIWITVGFVINMCNHGDEMEVSLPCFIVRAVIWSGFIYWFYIS